MKYTLIAALAAVCTLATAATAQEVRLHAASCFPRGSLFSERFEGMIDNFSETGPGTISVNSVGETPAICSQLTVV